MWDYLKKGLTVWISFLSLGFIYWVLFTILFTLIIRNFLLPIIFGTPIGHPLIIEYGGIGR